MMKLLLLAILLASSLSMMSYMYCWRDIRRGRPHIISLRQITNIMDRERLNALFGAPMPGYFYPLTKPAKAALVRTYQLHYYIECATDGVCVLGAWRYLVVHAGAAVVWRFIVLAAICQAINVVYSTCMVRKWAHQIKEEIDNSKD